MKRSTLLISLIAVSTLILSAYLVEPALAESKLLTPQLSVDIPDLKFTDGIVDGDTIKINYLADYIAAGYKWMIGAAVTIAIVMIMIGGLQWTLSGGSILGTGGKANTASAAKKRISNAVTGLVLLLSTYMILAIVNPNLIRLQFPELETIPFVSLPNETGTSLEDYEWLEATAVGDGGAGWNDVPMYNQISYVDTPYGICGNVKTSGCGVTSYAMIASFFSGTTIKPDAVAKVFADEKYRVCDDGTEPNPDGPCPTCNGTSDWAFYRSSYRDALGIEGRSIGTSEEKIKSALDSGELVIISYKTKSGGGHFVVITGYDEDNNVLVNNPYGGLKEKRTWAQIKSTIKRAVALKKE